MRKLPYLVHISDATLVSPFGGPSHPLFIWVVENTRGAWDWHKPVLAHGLVEQAKELGSPVIHYEFEDERDAMLFKLRFG